MPYKRSVRTVKSAFMIGKLLNLNNVRRWWKEIKGLTGLRCLESWVQQMLGDQLESTELLAKSFNTFLASLTADFVLLPQIIPGSFFPVPEHLLVDTHMVYEALRGIKSNKSGGPDPIPGKVWKEFGFVLSPVITNIYNALMVDSFGFRSNFPFFVVIHFQSRFEVALYLTRFCFLSNPKLSLYQNVRHPKWLNKIVSLFLSLPILQRSWKGLRWIPSSSTSVTSSTPTSLPWPGSPQPTLLFTSSKSSLRPEH